METDDSPATGSAEAAVAALEAATTQKMQQLRKSELKYLLQQAEMDGGDEGSGTEAGPKPRHKRPAYDSLLQRAAKKRAGLNSGPGDAAMPAEGGTGMVEGEEGSAAGASAGTSDGAGTTAIDSTAHATQQRRMLRHKRS